IAPLSTEIVTTQTPTLRWQLPDGVTGAHVEICQDRACAVPIFSANASGTSLSVPSPLPLGTVFWRLFGRDAQGTTGTLVSPTCKFTVPASSAGVSPAWETAPDYDGDGFADFPAVSGQLGIGISHGGPGGPPAAPTTQLPETPISLATGDLDGD